MKKIILIALTFGILLTACDLANTSSPASPNTGAEGNNNVLSTENDEHNIIPKPKDDEDTSVPYTAAEAVAKMKIGWNLGNTLDAIDIAKCMHDGTIFTCEQGWGNPITTKAMIDEVKKGGFNAVRVPVTYRYHIEPDGTIDAKWLNRVEEVIGYVLDNDMFCVLDVHHDCGMFPDAWIHSATAVLADSKINLANIWLQVATRFKDFNYKLIFEGMNEPVDKFPGPHWAWDATGNEVRKNVNQLNQTFVDTVRATGGNNSERVLVLANFSNSSSDLPGGFFEKPTDTAKDKIILAIHSYRFTEAEIDTLMSEIKFFQNSSQVVPIIIGEFASEPSDLSDPNKDEPERADSAAYYVMKAKEIGVTCFWWDDGGRYRIFNRATLVWRFPEILDAIMANF